jgi:hypothetical protein
VLSSAPGACACRDRVPVLLEFVLLELVLLELVVLGLVLFLGLVLIELVLLARNLLVGSDMLALRHTSSASSTSSCT